MGIWIIYTIGVLVLLFGVVVFVGAPYLPTFRHQIETALDLAGLSPGQTLLELGSGDGKVLIAAAKRGYHAVGIEINPLLVAIAKIRTWKYRSIVKVRWGNFWHMTWPKSDAVYVFLIDRYMPDLDKKMSSYGGKLVSIVFKIPGRKPDETKHDVHLYKYKKLLSQLDK